MVAGNWSHLIWLDVVDEDEGGRSIRFTPQLQWSRGPAEEARDLPSCLLLGEQWYESQRCLLIAVGILL